MDARAQRGGGSHLAGRRIATAGLALGTRCKDVLTGRRRKDTLTDMARYSGGPTIHRAMKGPRSTGVTLANPQAWKAEVITTLMAIQQVRQTCDHTELSTVKYARKSGLSWTEIAAALGVTRQSAWERWHEIDEALPKGDAWGPSSLNDEVPERFTDNGARDAARS